MNCSRYLGHHESLVMSQTCQQDQVFGWNRLNSKNRDIDIGILAIQGLASGPPIY